ncbi:MAG: hypothetical protein AABX52_04260, partial [Nanoarchaeota archaeon]
HEILGHLPCSAHTAEDAEMCARLTYGLTNLTIKKYQPRIDPWDTPLHPLNRDKEDKLDYHLAEIFTSLEKSYLQEHNITREEFDNFSCNGVFEVLVKARNNLNNSTSDIKTKQKK